MATRDPKLQAILDRFLDENEPEVVDACIKFLRKLGAAERIFAGEWLAEMRASRKEVANDPRIFERE